MKTKITSLFLVAAMAALCGHAVDATYVQSEVGIPYTPTAAVSAGDVLVLSNSLVAVALGNIDAGALGSIMLRGVFEMAHAAETTYVGQNVYWDEDGDQYGNATTGTGAITTTATGNSWCGWATEATTATDGTVRVMLYPLGNVDATTLTISGNSTMAGTLAVTGVATFTAESVHNLGIDADYITTDAGAGIDTKTAGTLHVGASTATKVEIGDTGVGVEAQGPLTAKEDVLSDELDTETATALLIGKATATSVTVGASDAGVSIPGTLAVTGVATLTAAPVLVSTNTPGAITLTMTQAPTLADTGKATPVYINVTIGGVGYIIPAWPLTTE